MKRPIIIVTSGVLIAQCFASLAQGQQSNATTIVPVTGGRGGAFVGNAGDYNIQQQLQDNSAVMNAIIGRTAQIQDQDRQFLIGIVDRLNTHLLELVSLKQKFTILSQRATLDQVAIAEYLTLANDINAKNDVIISEIKTQTLVSRETLPSYDAANAGTMQATINNLGNINMAEVMKRVDGQRTQLLSDINSIQFLRLVTPLGQQISITENSLRTTDHLKGVRILESNQIAEFTNTIRLKRTPEADTIKYQQQSVDQTVNLMKNLVFRYGKQEWMRFSNDNDGKALKETMTSILDGFYRRSYLRKKFGIRMGAIQTIEYNKLPINLEDITKQPLTLAMSQFRGQGAATQEEVNAAFENARNFLELYDKKAMPVFASRAEILKQKQGQDYLAVNTNVLIRMNSAITYLSGQRKTAEILRDLMVLTLSDILEEKKLVENDLAGMAALHDLKYRGTAAQKTQANIRNCQIDFTLSRETHEKNCVALGVKTKATVPMFMNGRSVGEVFANLIMQYQNVERAKMQEARFKQELIDAALAGGMTDEERAEKNSAEDELFN